MLKSRALVVHPVLAALFPALFLFSRNVGEFRLGDLLRPAAFAAVFAVAAFAGLSLIMENARKAGASEKTEKPAASPK